MYLKTLSGLTLTFLAVVFIVMMQTVPSATTISLSNPHYSVIKANCLQQIIHPAVELKRI